MATWCPHDLKSPQFNMLSPVESEVREMQNLPSIHQNISMSKPERTIQSQCCGMFITVLGVIGSISWFILSLVLFVSSFYDHKIEFYSVIFFVLSVGCLSYFFLRIAFDKNYCSGNPEIIKMWPTVTAAVLLVIAALICPDKELFNEKTGKTTITNISMILSIAFSILGLFFNFVIWLFYFGDDEKDSCCLCFKPWRYVSVSQFNHMMNGQYYQEYPQVYPQQVYGYPPQAQPQAQTQTYAYPQQYPLQNQAPAYNPQTQTPPFYQYHPQ